MRFAHSDLVSSHPRCGADARVHSAGSAHSVAALHWQMAVRRSYAGAGGLECAHLPA